MNSEKMHDDNRLAHLKIQYKKLLSSYRSIQQKYELLQTEKEHVIEHSKLAVKKARQETANARARANRLKTKLQEFQSQNIISS